MITADTITDEQILELLDDALYREWTSTADVCRVALTGVVVQAGTRRKAPIRSKRHPAYRKARARCAEILSARAKEQP